VPVKPFGFSIARSRKLSNQNVRDELSYFSRGDMENIMSIHSFFFSFCLLAFSLNSIQAMLSSRQLLLNSSLRCSFSKKTYSSLAQALPIRATSGVQRQRQTAARPFKPVAPLQPLQPAQQQQQQKTPSGRSRRDEEISARFITFVDEQGQVHNRCRLNDILNEFDRSRYFLVEVDPTAKPNPVCRLLDKKHMFDREKQSKKKKQTAPESILKEIVFGWNVSPHDMEHKLNKAIQFLDKGNKVKIDIVYKRGQLRVDKETQNAVVKTVSNLLEEYKLTKKPAFAGSNCSMQYEKK
jgi:translation initiation factor IF-3